MSAYSEFKNIRDTHRSRANIMEREEHVNVFLQSNKTRANATTPPNPTPSIPPQLTPPPRTYYILHPVHNPTTIAACGGWSFRQTLYGGNNAPSSLRMPAKRNPVTDRASIRAIFTHPSFARQGLGTMMMRHCEARAAEGNEETAGFERLEMGATLSGVALYERCGYVRSGREDVVECPNGEGIRVVHMVKDLEMEGP
jgi:GNAT superfamily N-acetyltransferase